MVMPKVSTIGRDVQHTNSRVTFVALHASDDRGALNKRSMMTDFRLGFFQWKGAVMLNFGMEVLEGSDSQTADRPGRSRLR